MRNLYLLAFAALSVCFASTAKADLNTYTWSGFFEDSSPSNPWGLAGDGSTATLTDGSPYTINVFLNSAAIDTANFANQALFDVTNTTDLKIAGTPVQITSGTVRFGDGTFDLVVFVGTGTFNGVNLAFATGLYVPGTTFEINNDASADAPPLFSPAVVVGDTYSANGGSVYSIVTKNSILSVTSVPEPCLAGPLLVAMVGAPMWRRFRKSRA